MKLITLCIEGTEYYQALVDTTTPELEKLTKRFQKHLRVKGNSLVVQTEEDVTGSLDELEKVLTDAFGVTKEEEVKPRISLELTEMLNKVLEELKEVLDRVNISSFK